MLKKYIKKILSILIIVLIISVHILPTSVYAGFIDSARSESGPEPPPETPSDTPITNPPSTSSGVEIRYRYNKINGNVYEDLGTTFIQCNENENNHKLQSISGIVVNLLKNNTVVRTTRTDSNGNYSFYNIPDGTYSVEFWYGDIAGATSPEEIKNRIKYNGHDYIAVKTPQQSNYLDSVGAEIESIGDGAVQIYLAIDCSYSMRNEYFESTRKIDYIVDAAKSLCQSLLNLNDNIYIGLIFFSGTNYRAASLTKNINSLNAALDDIKTNDWQTPNTNILGALDKAEKSFYGNKKNRYLVLLSDGIPTSDGNTMVYNTDSDSEIMNKINSISNATKNKLIHLKNKDISTICLFTASNDDEIQLVKNTFRNNSTMFQIFNNINVTVNTIKNTLLEYIRSQAAHSIQTYSESHDILAGYEDPARRNLVDNMFASSGHKLDYNNTIMFDQIQNYTDYNTARNLSDSTKMLVKGGNNYVITNTLPADFEITDSDGNVIKTIKYQFAQYNNVDLWIAKRAQFQLATQITATYSKITSPDLYILNEETRQVGAGQNDFILHTVDPTIFYGSTLEIEYTVAIHNNSPFQSNYIEVLVQIPKEYTLKSCSHPYEKVNTSDLINNNLITSNVNNGKETFKITLDNNHQGESGFYIPPGGSHNIAVTITRVTAEFDDESIEFIEPISAEILKYSDSAHRRMTYNTTTTNLLGIYPGNGIELDYSNTLTNSKIVIIPPTGTSVNSFTLIITLISLLTIITLVLILHRLK